MTTATIAIDMDVPAGVTVDEYERIDDGHAFHVSWELPDRPRCETCKREAALQRVEKNKFLAIRDLDLWGKPSFFVYQEVQHRCPHCGHRQSLLPSFKRRDVKYTFRFEEQVLVSLIGGTAEDVAQRLGIGAIGTGASGINDSGQIVGSYWDGSATHGFLLDQGNYTMLDVPGSYGTAAKGINASGQIVGYYYQDSFIHGFLFHDGKYTQLDVPGSDITQANGINASGQIVGAYYDAFGKHGFLATPVP